MKTPVNQIIVSLNIVLLCAVFTSGCAFGTRQAKIVYPPQLAKTNKLSVISAPPGSQGDLVLQSFTDDRADKRLVGHVRNGYGMKTAEVVANEDLTQVLNEAVSVELARAGYNVFKADGSAPPTAPVIGGALVQLYCDAYLSYEGSASIYVRVLRGTTEVFRKTYQGKGSAGFNWAATGASYGTSLSLAIQDALELMKRDLPVALKQ